MYGRVRAAHLALNLLGLVGLVIVGTLPSFTATQVRVKMSPRASRPAQSLVLAWFVGALGAATVGFLAARPVVAAIGLSAYAAGILGLVALLPTIRAKQLRWAGPRLVQLGAGVAWWVGATVVAAWHAGHATDVFTPTVVGVLVVGGYAQILAAAVAYLGPVLRAGGHEQLTAGFRTTRSWFALGAANVAAIALVLGASEVAGAAIFIWVIDTAARAAGLVRGARWTLAFGRVTDGSKRRGAEL
jgi:nitrite reductase (NO-forming)